MSDLFFNIEHSDLAPFEIHSKWTFVEIKITFYENQLKKMQILLLRKIFFKK